MAGRARWALLGWCCGATVILDDAPRSNPARYHEQQQDHFDPGNNVTWPQAYYVNDTFWQKGSGAPIFLCVGGEGPALDASAVQNSVHCSIAVEGLKAKKALMFALEHRYYGCHNRSACPVQDLAGPDALMYLSSRQAVEDIASFVKAMNAKYSLTRNRWVTWGGSYPGMLAGWSRLKHPELIHASVASSAPVSATFDMPEYMDHMAFAYTVSDNAVGGSPQCRDAIRAGHAWIEESFKAGNFSAVATRFGLAEKSLDTLDQRIAFASSGVADFPAQENDPLCEQPACNIAKVCAIMTNSTFGDEVERLLQLRKAQGVAKFSRRGRWQAQLASGSSSLRLGLNGVYEAKDELPDFWFFQTCREFGFYQTCEATGGCMFVRDLANVSYYAANCMKLYNITLGDVQSNIDGTNYHYGGLLPTGTKGQLGRCVMFPNGEVDPWSTRSVLQSPGKDLPTLYVSGASHHAWTWPSRKGDQESVMAARTKIREQVDAFFQMDCDEDAPQGQTPRSPVLLISLIGVATLGIATCAFVRCRRPRVASARQPLTTSLQPA
ncbi:unnamed protein product [Effrenium voratum]|uniref:Uncharacterized protein n=1 Tax=Effrenium voratum TaxID=2562239 RepID=A0AA36HLZ4_9DINO|nr:unnamed protein product [Effrenium voratum]CAJ1438945.1 unnamed protein product [Effrenium voratum]